MHSRKQLSAERMNLPKFDVSVIASKQFRQLGQSVVWQIAEA